MINPLRYLFIIKSKLQQFYDDVLSLIKANLR
jgi:hypothetical protein